MTATPVEGMVESNTEVTPEQLRAMSIEELDKLLAAEGIEVPDSVDVTSVDAIVDWVITQFS